MTIDEIFTMLNKKSGLLGLSGVSNDMRAIKDFLGIERIEERNYPADIEKSKIRKAPHYTHYKID